MFGGAATCLSSTIISAGIRSHLGTVSRNDHIDTDSDVGQIAEVQHESGFHWTFTPRQIHVISLGGQIGAGLFISTAKNLSNGGPASLLLGFALIYSCVWAVLNTVSEMTRCSLHNPHIHQSQRRGYNCLQLVVEIASTGYFMVWLVISIISFRFRAALKAQNNPLFSELYTWRCALWPLPPIWPLTYYCFFIGTSFYVALYPTKSDTPTAEYSFQYMFGIILIVFTALGYKLMYRTKIRDPRTLDLQTGRRPLGVVEIKELDDYKNMPHWRRFVSFVQLW
ncbi:hypothetical protein BDV10DRAFT_184887 [Aspergillus recurvatus]